MIVLSRVLILLMEALAVSLVPHLHLQSSPSACIGITSNTRLLRFKNARNVCTSYLKLLRIGSAERCNGLWVYNTGGCKYVHGACLAAAYLQLSCTGGAE
jgi:hypothetical protein